MVDLQGQYKHIKSEIDAAIQGVIDNTAFIGGPEVKEFQAEMEEYLSVKHVVPCANGTDALQVAMMALGLKPGDEVITASFTFVATAEVIALLQLTPVLVDVLPDTFTIDPQAIERAITPNTKAIVPVHLFGQCADMVAILEIARKYNLYVIEDTAQAIGAEYTFSDGQKAMAGTMGDIGTTSFFPSKNLGCYGDGGAIFTNNDSLAEGMRIIANHGSSVRYYHDAIGVNSRLDSMQAAILRIKLRKLEEYNLVRNIAASYYTKRFEQTPQLVTPRISACSSHVFHQYTLVTKGINRSGLIEYLNSKGIPAMVYYPVPLHLQKAYQDSRYQEGDFPVTENLCKSVVSLPMHTELDDEQLNYIVTSLLEYIQEKH